MKRTGPLRRHTELHQTASLQRHAFMRAVNPERKAKRKEAGEVYGPYHRWVADDSEAPCVLYRRGGHLCEWVGDRRRMEGHHVKRVGSGGKDAGNEVRVCPLAHDTIEATAPSVLVRRYDGVDLEAEALALYVSSPFYHEEAA